MRGRWIAPVVGLTAVVALLAPPAGAEVTPALVLSPSTGLLDRHEVGVTLTGLDPGEEYVLLDCAADACVDDRAYWLTISTLATPLSDRYDPLRRFVEASAGGTASTTISVRRGIVVGDGEDDAGRPADCSAEPCTVAVARVDGDDEIIVASAPVTFAATGTYVWPAASAALAPAGPYRHGQDMTVTGSGFTPDIFDAHVPSIPGSLFGAVTTQQCLAGASPPAGCEETGPAEMFFGPSPVLDVADDGTVSDTVVADRFLKLSATDTRDCAVEDCTLTAAQLGGKSRSGALPLDFGPVWAPWSSAGAMIDGLCTLLGAEAMHDGDRSVLVQGLLAGTTTVAGVVQAIAAHDRVAGDVATLYASLLGRRPDGAGLRYWVARLRAGTSPGRLADIFANTPEVRDHHAASDDAAAVDWTYGAVLGRAPDAAGKEYWLGRLAAGLPRFRMVSMFALSTESRTRTADRRVITAVTLGLADREPTALEWGGPVPFPGPQPPGLLGSLWDVIDAAPAFRTQP
jgi:hypothetical protein